MEVTPRGFPWLGGVETHVHNLSEAMIRRGADVTVLTSTTTRDDGTHANRTESEIIDNVPYHRFRLPKRGLWELPSPRLLRDIRRHAKAADVVHLHLYHQPLAAMTTAALTGVRTPLVVTPHYHGTGHTPLASRLHTVWRPTAGRFLMSRADAVIAVSQPEADLLVEHFPFLQGRVQVIPNGIIAPAPAEPHPVPEGTRVVLSVGRLAPYKRHDAVIRALPHLTGPVLFVLVGDGPDRERLATLATDLGVLDRVHFAGRVDDETLAGWWARANVFVSLSEQEAFGLAVGEALAAGVPAVVSDIPAFRFVADLASREGAPADAVTVTPARDLPQALEQAPGRFPPVNVMRWDIPADTTRDLLASIRKTTQ